MVSKLYVGQCTLDLHVPNCQSLKEKRRVIKSIKERLKNRYNVSVCEFGDLSLWQRTQLGIVTCGNERTIVDSTIKTVINFLERVHTVTLLDVKQRVV
ncbi:MAG: DUF503 domain-containing protein [bacterium]